MTSLAVRLMEIDATQLEEFIELWVERRSAQYDRIERIGAANDKGRDVIGFLTSARHEGPWHLFQCKRKTRGSKLGKSEALCELGKVFFHHCQGAYNTLPEKYVFVAPRGIVGSLLDLINNPSTLAAALIDGWDEHCSTQITRRMTVTLTREIKAAVASFDFSRVEHLTAPMIVKDPAAGPALSKLLGLMPEEAPSGAAPDLIQPEEARYADQLRIVYGEASGIAFVSADDVLAHADHGEHFRDQRTRFFEAASFKRFHRDNTAPGVLVTFENDVYHGVIDVHRDRHETLLRRVDAVMRHASILPASLIGRTVRIPVKQGICHHLANEGRLKWAP
ncbi:MAG: hypothetical protein J0H44_21515 [Alphaproteobacteria bacterium]|nr:hypothetical protein [Alphaproteobacteria bacterium]